MMLKIFIIIPYFQKYKKKKIDIYLKLTINY